MLLRGWQIKNSNDQLGMLQSNLLKRKESELWSAVREDPMKIDITKLKITNESLFIQKKTKIRFLKFMIQNLEIWELFQITG